MKTRAGKISQLKEYFTKRGDVLMAFLFGSQASGKARTLSDWDIAVYFVPRQPKIEWEESRTYPEEDHIWKDLTDILATDSVDLLVLNRAPASIAETAVQGEALVIKDGSLRRKFVGIVSSIAQDYRRFVDEFYAISQRSQSLTDRDREDMQRTISFLEEQVGLYGVYRQFTREEYEREPRKRNEIERWLENIVNAIIDISKVSLASRKRPIPPTYRETVTRALSELELPEMLGEQCDQWVRLRNDLAHEYLDIKWQRLTAFAQDSEESVRGFISGAKQFIKQEKMA